MKQSIFNMTEEIIYYLEALHNNMVENDVDMLIDKCESPQVVADKLRKLLKEEKG